MPVYFSFWKWAREFKKKALFYIFENGNPQCLYTLVFENGPENFLKKAHFLHFRKWKSTMPAYFSFWKWARELQKKNTFFFYIFENGNSQCLYTLVLKNGLEDFFRKVHFRKWKFTMPVYFSFWKWIWNLLKKAPFLHFRTWKFTKPAHFSFWKGVGECFKKGTFFF